jgi:hypothetical protein
MSTSRTNSRETPSPTTSRSPLESAISSPPALATPSAESTSRTGTKSTGRAVRRLFTISSEKPSARFQYDSFCGLIPCRRPNAAAESPLRRHRANARSISSRRVILAIPHLLGENLGNDNTQLKMGIAGRLLPACDRPDVFASKDALVLARRSGSRSIRTTAASQ